MSFASLGPDSFVKWIDSLLPWYIATFTKVFHLRSLIVFGERVSVLLSALSKHLLRNRSTHSSEPVPSLSECGIGNDGLYNFDMAFVRTAYCYVSQIHSPRSRWKSKEETEAVTPKTPTYCHHKQLVIPSRAGHERTFPRQ